MKKVIYSAVGALLMVPMVASAGEPVDQCLNGDCPPVVVSEPSTLALLGAGLAVAALIKFRNRNK